MEPGAAVYTDAPESYSGLSGDFEHATVDHAERYVDGQVHTNGIENFWPLLKRGLHGTYVSVEPFHLFPDWPTVALALPARTRRS